MEKMIELKKFLENLQNMKIENTEQFLQPFPAAFLKTLNDYLLDLADFGEETMSIFQNMENGVILRSRYSLPLNGDKLMLILIRASKNTKNLNLQKQILLTMAKIAPLMYIKTSIFHLFALYDHFCKIEIDEKQKILLKIKEILKPNCKNKPENELKIELKEEHKSKPNVDIIGEKDDIDGLKIDLKETKSDPKISNIAENMTEKFVKSIKLLKNPKNVIKIDKNEIKTEKIETKSKKKSKALSLKLPKTAIIIPKYDKNNKINSKSLKCSKNHSKWPIFSPKSSKLSNLSPKSRLKSFDAKNFPNWNFNAKKMTKSLSCDNLAQFSQPKNAKNGDKNRPKSLLVLKIIHRIFSIKRPTKSFDMSLLDRKIELAGNLPEKLSTNSVLFTSWIELKNDSPSKLFTLKFDKSKNSKSKNLTISISKLGDQAQLEIFLNIEKTPTKKIVWHTRSKIAPQEWFLLSLGLAENGQIVGFINSRMFSFESHAKIHSSIKTRVLLHKFPGSMASAYLFPAYVDKEVICDIFAAGPDFLPQVSHWNGVYSLRIPFAPFDSMMPESQQFADKVLLVGVHCQGSIGEHGILLNFSQRGCSHFSATKVEHSPNNKFGFNELGGILLMIRYFSPKYSEKPYRSHLHVEKIIKIFEKLLVGNIHFQKEFLKNFGLFEFKTLFISPIPFKMRKFSLITAIKLFLKSIQNIGHAQVLDGIRHIFIDYEFWGKCQLDVQIEAINLIIESLVNSGTNFRQFLSLKECLLWLQFVYPQHFLVTNEMALPIYDEKFEILKKIKTICTLLISVFGINEKEYDSLIFAINNSKNEKITKNLLEILQICFSEVKNKISEIVLKNSGSIPSLFNTLQFEQCQSIFFDIIRHIFKLKFLKGEIQSFKNAAVSFISSQVINFNMKKSILLLEICFDKNKEIWNIEFYTWVTRRMFESKKENLLDFLVVLQEGINFAKKNKEILLKTPKWQKEIFKKICSINIPKNSHKNSINDENYSNNSEKSENSRKKSRISQIWQNSDNSQNFEIIEKMRKKSKFEKIRRKLKKLEKIDKNSQNLENLENLEISGKIDKNLEKIDKNSENLKKMRKKSQKLENDEKIREKLIKILSEVFFTSLTTESEKIGDYFQNLCPFNKNGFDLAIFDILSLILEKIIFGFKSNLNEASEMFSIFKIYDNLPILLELIENYIFVEDNFTVEKYNVIEKTLILYQNIVNKFSNNFYRFVYRILSIEITEKSDVSFIIRFLEILLVVLKEITVQINSDFNFSILAVLLKNLHCKFFKSAQKIQYRKILTDLINFLKIKNIFEDIIENCVSFNNIEKIDENEIVLVQALILTNSSKGDHFKNGIKQESELLLQKMLKIKSSSEEESESIKKEPIKDIKNLQNFIGEKQLKKHYFKIKICRCLIEETEKNVKLNRIVKLKINTMMKEFPESNRSDFHLRRVIDITETKSKLRPFVKTIYTRNKFNMAISRASKKSTSPISHYRSISQNPKLEEKTMLIYKNNRVTNPRLSISAENLFTKQLISKEIEEYDDFFLLSKDTKTVVKNFKKLKGLNEAELEFICQYINPFYKITGKAFLTPTHFCFLGIYNRFDDEGYFENEFKGEIKNAENVQFEIDEKDCLFKIMVRYTKFVEIYPRLFLQSKTAIEMFCSDYQSIYLIFQNEKIRNDFYLQLSTKTNLEYTLNDRTRLLNSRILQKWQNGALSNFDFLLKMNFLAGRSFNDLSQYPVFPWVLKNYTSTTIDLKDENIYRDLSKPVGALELERAEYFKRRFEELHDGGDFGMDSAFHYGTHYSAAAIVLHYLIRLEPYSSWMFNLHSGSFDIPDRLFNSIDICWNMVNTQLSDVREIIPEFFFNAEMFKNNSRINFGICQDGTVVDDVILPPWAKTPEEFVSIHRKALESKYVTENLNKWIDLIFGYKQKGEEAIKALNVFYPLTYPGVVDFENIKDEIVKKATEIQILNFGQTPNQILTQPCPKKQFFKRKKKLNDTPGVQLSYKHTVSPIIYVTKCSDKIIIIDHFFTVTIIQNFKKSSDTNSIFNFKKQKILTESICCEHQLSSLSTSKSPATFPIAVWHEKNLLFLAGFVDNTIKVYSIKKSPIFIQSINKHSCIVTIIKTPPSNNNSCGYFMASGGFNGSIRLWKIRSDSSGESPNKIEFKASKIQGCKRGRLVDLSFGENSGVLVAISEYSEFSDIQNISDSINYTNYMNNTSLTNLTDNSDNISKFSDIKTTSKQYSGYSENISSLSDLKNTRFSEFLYSARLDVFSLSSKKILISMNLRNLSQKIDHFDYFNLLEFFPRKDQNFHILNKNNEEMEKIDENDGIFDENNENNKNFGKNENNQNLEKNNEKMDEKDRKKGKNEKIIKERAKISKNFFKGVFKRKNKLALKSEMQMIVANDDTIIIYFNIGTNRLAKITLNGTVTKSILVEEEIFILKSFPKSNYFLTSGESQVVSLYCCRKLKILKNFYFNVERLRKSIIIKKNENESTKDYLKRLTRSKATSVRSLEISPDEKEITVAYGNGVLSCFKCFDELQHRGSKSVLSKVNFRS